MINYRIKINFQDTKILTSDIELVSGDVGAYKFSFEFYNNGKRVDISNYTLSVRAKRSDGVVVAGAGSIQDNTAVFVPENNFYAVPGELYMEIALSDSAGRYATTKIIIASVVQGLGESAIEGADNLSVYVTLLNDVQSKIDQANKLMEDAENSAGKAGVGENAEIFNDYESNNASGSYSHAEGESTIASGSCSHAEGNSTIASGSRSHAEGLRSVASGIASHAEGYKTEASGDLGSHAEGYQTKASGHSCHSEGHETLAMGNYGTHAEGLRSVASGEAVHAEGYQTKAYGYSSHSEGHETLASGNYGTHAEGLHTIAASNSQHVQGKYNIEDADGIYAHIVGSGADESHRKNIHTIDWSGNAEFAGTVKSNGKLLATEEYVQSYIEETILGGAW